jgi:hypothetical protein
VGTYTPNTNPKFDNAIIYTIAGTFAIPLLAAFVVPGILATAICFTVPFVGAAYLCGKTLGALGEQAEAK